MNTEHIYKQHLEYVLENGEKRSSRGLHYTDVPNHRIAFDMNNGFVVNEARKVYKRYAITEAAWVLNGQNDLATVARVNTRMSEFSDNGYSLAGAYGPKVVDQIPYIVRTLNADTGSRQAVMTIWERKPEKSKDIPCTIGLQFRIWDKKLQTTVYMRSSDLFLGIPYDLFVFTMVTAEIRRQLADDYGLGEITFMLGSSHIYDHNVDKCKEIINSSHAVNAWKFNPKLLTKGPATVAQRLLVCPPEELICMC